MVTVEVARSETKLVVHEFKGYLGVRSLKKSYNEGRRDAIINGVMHTAAIRWPVWRRLAHIALDRDYDEPIFITEGVPPKEALTALYGESHNVRIMTPRAYCKQVTVKKPILVICPVRPTSMYRELVDALLQAKELHFIRSYDHAQEKFFAELRRGAAKHRTTSFKEIWYYDSK